MDQRGNGETGRGEDWIPEQSVIGSQVDSVTLSCYLLFHNTKIEWRRMVEGMEWGRKKQEESWKLSWRGSDLG